MQPWQEVVVIVGWIVLIGLSLAIFILINLVIQAWRNGDLDRAAQANYQAELERWKARIAAEEEKNP